MGGHRGVAIRRPGIDGPMTEQLPVAMLGANGRMGAEAVKAIEAAADLNWRPR